MMAATPADLSLSGHFQPATFLSSFQNVHVCCQEAGQSLRPNMEFMPPAGPKK